ncbi:MAG: OmpA family protein [Pseudomonadota bacterium]
MMIRSVFLSGTVILAMTASLGLAQSSDDQGPSKEERAEQAAAEIEALFSDKGREERREAGAGPEAAGAARPIDDLAINPSSTAAKKPATKRAKPVARPKRRVTRTSTSAAVRVNPGRRTRTISNPCFTGKPTVARPATVADSLEFNVTFATNSATLTPGSFEDIEYLASGLKTDRLAGKKFLVEGHSDCVGNATYNRELSQRRAEAVKSALVEAGVSADNLVAIGFGEERRIEGMKPNARELRRVELTPIELETE